MALSTYAELVTSVQDWLHRTDLASQAADFVTLAESEINADVHMRLMEADESVTLTVGTRTIALPSRFIEPISLELELSGQDNDPLIYQPPHRLVINEASGASSRPRYWTVNGAYLEFPNLSDDTYTLNFRMVKGFDLASTTTNSLLSSYPGLYLYGALLQAAPYMLDDKRILTWRNMYDKLLTKVKQKESRKNALTSLVTDLPVNRTAGYGRNIITG